MTRQENWFLAGSHHLRDIFLRDINIGPGITMISLDSFPCTRKLSFTHCKFKVLS